MAQSLQAQRLQARREDLLAAGIPLIGAPEGTPVGVRKVCRAAGLTERYFYQAFGGREGFIHAVYDRVADQARDALAASIVAGADPEVQARASVQAFIALMIDRPAMGRVLLLGPSTEPVLGRRGPLAAIEFVSLVQGSLPGPDDESLRHMSALAIVGALTGVFAAHLGGTLDVSRAQLIDFCVRLILDGHRAPGVPGFALRRSD